jgi:DNA-binding NarL/FixJ family response regulator
LNNPDNKIKIAMIDDDINILNDISTLLNDFKCLEFIGGYKNCSEAINNFYLKAPQILLLDLNLKEGNGIDFIPSLISCSPALKIVIYSNYYSQEKALEAKDAGAKGYILKNVQIKSLYESIITVYEGSEIWPEEIVSDKNQITKNNSSGILRLFRRFKVP